MKTLSYIGFRKNHPHDEHSVIRMGFIVDPYEADQIPLINAGKGLMRNACNGAIQVLSEILEDFK